MLSLKRHDFRKKKKDVIENKMCILISSTTFDWNISHYKNWVRYDQKYILVFLYSTRYSYPILMKSEISGKFFEK